MSCKSDLVPMPANYEMGFQFSENDFKPLAIHLIVLWLIVFFVVLTEFGLSCIAQPRLTSLASEPAVTCLNWEQGAVCFQNVSKEGNSYLYLPKS